MRSRDSGDEWARILKAAARAMDNGHATFSIRDPDRAERHLLIGMTGSYRKDGTRAIRVQLSQFDRHVQQNWGITATELITQQLGRAPGAAKARQQHLQQDAERLITAASQSALSQQEWFTTWLEQLRTNGTISRLVQEGQDLGPVVRLLEQLPVDNVPVPIVGERYFADTKALSHSHQRGILLRALAAQAGCNYPTHTAGQRELLERAGIVADDMASQVLVLNMPVRGGPIADWMRTAAGIPFRLTLQQLQLTELTVPASMIFVVENPSVLRAATNQLLGRCPPLVCSEGVPSAALHHLLDAAPHAQIHWRADFDWSGVGIVRRALERYPDAAVWRMSAQDYVTSTRQAEGVPLTGSPQPTPWDSELSTAMATGNRAIMEEALLPDLLADLSDKGAPGQAPAGIG